MLYDWQENYHLSLVGYTFYTALPPWLLGYMVLWAPIHMLTLNCTPQSSVPSPAPLAAHCIGLIRRALRHPTRDYGMVASGYTPSAAVTHTHLCQTGTLPPTLFNRFVHVFTIHSPYNTYMT